MFYEIIFGKNVRRFIMNDGIKLVDSNVLESIRDERRIKPSKRMLLLAEFMERKKGKKEKNSQSVHRFDGRLGDGSWR